MQKAIKKLTTLLNEMLPKSAITVDSPDHPDGNWWIDVVASKKRVTLEYRTQKGFGVFHKKSAYGEGTAEIYRTPELASRRVLQLIRAKTNQRQSLTLKNLRELYKCSQIDLAGRVGVKQAAISRLEQRSEVKLGTLAAAVEALGGELEIRAHFSDADVPISVKD